MEERGDRSPARTAAETSGESTNSAIPDNLESVEQSYDHTQTADGSVSETEEEEVYTSSVRAPGGFASHVTGGNLDEYLQEKLASKDPRSVALSDHRNLVRTVLRTVSLIQDLDAGDQSPALVNYKSQLIQTLDKTHKKFLAKFAVDRVLAVRLSDSDSVSQIREKLRHPLNLLRLAGEEADSESYRILENPNGVNNLAALCCVVTYTRDSLAVLRILQGLATCSRQHLSTEFLGLFCEFVVEIITKNKPNHEMKIHAVRVLKYMCNGAEEVVDLLIKGQLVQNVLAAMASVPSEKRNNAECTEFYTEAYELIVSLTRQRSGFESLLASAAVHVSESSMPRRFVELFGRLIETGKATFGLENCNQVES